MMDDENDEAGLYIPVWEVAVRHDCLKDTRTPLRGFEALLSALIDKLTDIRTKVLADEGLAEEQYLQTEACLQMVQDACVLAEYCPSAPTQFELPDEPLGHAEVGLRRFHRGGRPAPAS